MHIIFADSQVFDASHPWIAYVALGIAIIGFAQPYILWTYKQVFKRRKVRLYQTWAPEIGFSGLGGPTLGITGALDNENAASFVTAVNAHIRRAGAANGAKLFEATLSRRRWMSTSASPTEATQWVPFRMEPDETYPYDLFFTNKEARERINSIRNELNAQFIAFVQSKLPPGLEFWREEVQAQVKEGALAAFPAFQQTGDYAAAIQRLEKVFPWEVSTYNLAVEVTLSSGSRFAKRWSFALSEPMIQGLRSNVVRIAAEACAQPPVVVGTYFFAYPPYQL